MRRAFCRLFNNSTQNSLRLRKPISIRVRWMVLTLALVGTVRRDCIQIRSISKIFDRLTRVIIIFSHRWSRSVKVFFFINTFVGDLKFYGKHGNCGTPLKWSFSKIKISLILWKSWAPYLVPWSLVLVESHLSLKSG